jgi:hypothetical protein
MVRLLLYRPRVFFAIVTVGLGLLGALHLLGGRFGTQPVHGGAVGFAYGVSFGMFAAAVFFAYRRTGSETGAKAVGLAGALAIIAAFVVLTR